MTNQAALVSVIIPTYNRAHLIGETLDSILAQTYTNWECIVVDDGSTDHTAQIMKSYCRNDKRFQYHHRPKDRLGGGNAARNYGFELSKGKYIQWFDSDDVMHPKKLMIQVGVLEESNFNFSVCDTLIFENSIFNIVTKPKRKLFSDNLISDFITYKVIVLTPNILIKKEFLNLLEKLYDERLTAAQDWEFNFRLLYKAKIYHVCNTPLAYIRKHSKNISSNKKHLLVNQYFLARLKIYQNPSLILNKEEKRHIQEFLQRYFKKMVRLRDVNSAIKAFGSFVALEKEYTYKAKTFAFLSMLSFGIFNRGDIFLKHVKYKYE